MRAPKGTHREYKGTLMPPPLRELTGAAAWPAGVSRNSPLIYLEGIFENAYACQKPFPRGWYTRERPADGLNQIKNEYMSD